MPRFELPEDLESDNGPTVMARVSQNLTKVLTINGSYIVCIGTELRSDRKDG